MGTLLHRFIRAHLTPWVGLYSVMSEDSVRKLAKTVFPLCENEDNKRSLLKNRKVNESPNSWLGTRCVGTQAKSTPRSLGQRALSG